MAAGDSRVEHIVEGRASALGALRLYLYHRPDEMAASGLAARTLEAYAHEVAAAGAAAFADTGADEWLEAVVAVRPGYRSRVWPLSPRPAGDPRLARVRGEVEAIPAPLVSRLVVFAVSGTLGRGAPRWRARPDGVFPWPAAWPGVAPGDAGTFERVVLAAWPETGAAPPHSAPPRVAAGGLIDAGHRFG